MPEPWKKLSETEVRVGFKKIVSKHFEMPDGSVLEWTTFHHMGAQNVTVVALTEDSRVVIARQFRPGPELVMDELPGGDVDEGEDAAIAAARELREETGYASDEAFEPLGPGYRSAYSNERDNYFLARNCHKVGEPQPSEGEFVEVDLISIEKLLENAKTGKTTESTAVLLAYDKLMEAKKHGKSN
jgi:ADP-ribose pyrophosphatase